MAENIEKIDERIRELKRKKKAVLDQEKIREYNAFIKSVNHAIEEPKFRIKKIGDVIGFLRDQEERGKFFSKWQEKTSEKQEKPSEKQDVSN